MVLGFYDFSNYFYGLEAKNALIVHSIKWVRGIWFGGHSQTVLTVLLMDLNGCCPPHLTLNACRVKEVKRFRVWHWELFWWHC